MRERARTALLMGAAIGVGLVAEVLYSVSWRTEAAAWRWSNWMEALDEWRTGED